MSLLLALAAATLIPLTNQPADVDQAHVELVWEFVQSLAGRKDPPPIVYFTSEAEPRMTPRFLAFYYEHTRIIRMAHTAVTRLPGTGYVYVLLGHEMLHYVLIDTVPVEEHHCLFTREDYERRITEYLVQRGIAFPFLLNMPAEDGCE